MKLLFCTNCNDLFSLDLSLKKCSCGETKGKYKDHVNAVYWGIYAVPVGMSNHSFFEAIRKQTESGDGIEFKSFVIPVKCNTFEKAESN